MAADDPMTDDDGDTAAPRQPKVPSMVLTIIVVMLLFLLAVIASVGATLYFTGALHGDEAVAATGAGDEGGAKQKKKKVAKKGKSKTKKDPPIYVELGDPFVDRERCVTPQGVAVSNPVGAPFLGGFREFNRE